MLTLYFITTYSHERNIKMRYHVSAENEEAAKASVQDALADDWKITSVQAICTTSDKLWLEH